MSEFKPHYLLLTQFKLAIRERAGFNTHNEALQLLGSWQLCQKEIDPHFNRHSSSIQSRTKDTLCIGKGAVTPSPSLNRAEYQPGAKIMTGFREVILKSMSGGSSRSGHSIGPHRHTRPENLAYPPITENNVISENGQGRSAENLGTLGFGWN
jgi:hypothetical protein